MQTTQHNKYTHLSCKRHSYTYNHTHCITHTSTFTSTKYTRNIHKAKVKIGVPPWKTVDAYHVSFSLNKEAVKLVSPKSVRQTNMK